MAFQILSSEELLLLDEKKREQYDKALELYQMRAAFVEQMEREENIQFDSYEIKQEAIAVPSKLHVQTFKVKKYVPSGNIPKMQTTVRFNAYKQTKQSWADLPFIAKQTGMQVKPLEKLPHHALKLPKVEKPQIPNSEMKHIVCKAAERPIFTKPNAPILHFKERDNRAVVLTDQPKIQAIPVSSKSFEPAKAVLPTVLNNPKVPDLPREQNYSVNVQVPAVLVTSEIPNLQAKQNYSVNVHIPAISAIRDIPNITGGQNYSVNVQMPTLSAMPKVPNAARKQSFAVNVQMPTLLAMPKVPNAAVKQSFAVNVQMPTIAANQEVPNLKWAPDLSVHMEMPKVPIIQEAPTVPEVLVNAGSRVKDPGFKQLESVQALIDSITVPDAKELMDRFFPKRVENEELKGMTHEE